MLFHSRTHPFTRTVIRFLWKSFFISFLLISLFVVSVKFNFLNLYGELPGFQVLEQPQNDVASELYASDGVLLGKYFKDENRVLVNYSDLSPNLIKALLAIEDHQFTQHAGIHLKSLFRVFFLSLLLKREAGGGSTISQQLAKNLFKIRDQKKLQQGLLNNVPLLKILIIKVKEWIVAVQLERAYTKEEIIAMYYNTVYFGSNAFGIQVAAQTFFKTLPKDLSIQQAALLVGMLKAPTKYNPIKNPERAIQRRNTVLLKMYKYQFIDQKTYQKTYQSPLELNYEVESHYQGLATYFRAEVHKFLLAWTKKHGYNLYKDGLKIYTTIDSGLQKHAEEAVYNHMKKLQDTFNQHWKDGNPWRDEEGEEIPEFIESFTKTTPVYKELMQAYDQDKELVEQALMNPVQKKLFSWENEIDTLISPVDEIRYKKRFLHAGMMAMEPATGQIKAWVGGINYKHFQYDHVIQGKRQPGSAFKPIVYAAALDNGYSPTYEVTDVPITFQMDGKDSSWTPQNWNKRYTGKKMTLQTALTKSVNAVTAYLMQQLGPELVIEYAHKLGIKSKINPVPAICLGTHDVSVYELVGAYSTFVNHGVFIEPFFITHIEDKNGNLIKVFKPKKNEALSEKTAYSIVKMLRNGIEAPNNSISEFLKEHNEIGGKTGTTSNHSDGWFVGITNQLTVGVWVGGEDRCIHFREMRYGAGAVTARPIWEKFMISLYKDPKLHFKKTTFSKPKKIDRQGEIKERKELSEKKAETFEINEAKQFEVEDIF